MRDRLPCGSGMGPFWLDAARLGSRGGHLKLCSRPYHLWVRAFAGDANGCRGIQRAAGRLPGLRPPCTDILPVPQHPRPLLFRLYQRHRLAAPACASRFSGVDRGLLGWELAHIRPTQQRSSDRKDPDLSGPRCRGRSFDAHIWSELPGGVSGHHRASG